MKHHHAVLLFAIGLGAAMGVAPAMAATDPFVGTWALDVAKSKMSGPPVKSEILKIEDAGGGKLKATDDITYSDGKTSHSDVTFAFDGKDYPANDTPAPANGPETDSFQRVDANTIKVTIKNGGKPSGTLTATVSADGKTQTATFSGTGPDGKPMTETGVYDRQ
jgi:hypothetical protein